MCRSWSWCRGQSPQKTKALFLFTTQLQYHEAPLLKICRHGSSRASNSRLGVPPPVGAGRAWRQHLKYQHNRAPTYCATHNVCWSRCRLRGVWPLSWCSEMHCGQEEPWATSLQGHCLWPVLGLSFLRVHLNELAYSFFELFGLCSLLGLWLLFFF